jgi:hypothetical protein
LDRRFRCITPHGATKEAYYSLYACKIPHILMGDKSLVEVTGKGRIELTNESLENVLHIPKLFIDLLSMYQKKNYNTRKRVILTHDVVDIYEIQTNSMVTIGVVNHQSRLYTFFEFIEPDYALKITHEDENNRIWHEMIWHLNFIYMQ